MIFTIADGRTSLYQYDTNVLLKINLEEGKKCDRVHFTNEPKVAYVASPFVHPEYGLVVRIADEVMQKSTNLVVLTWVTNDYDNELSTEQNGHTEVKEKINIKPRPKPENYVFTPSRKMSWEEWAQISQEWAAQAELWAVGKVYNAEGDDFDVAEGAPQYQNNAKYYAGVAEDLKNAVQIIKEDTEQIVEDLPQTVDKFIADHRGEFKGEKGDKGETGDTGVYLGSNTPTDPDKNVWIDPAGEILIDEEIEEIKKDLSEVDSRLSESIEDISQKVDHGLDNDGIKQRAYEATQEWLDEHPEATTTVEDESLGVVKFTSEAKKHVVKDYVTPQMYGAVGDGEHDDTLAIQNAINSNKPVSLPNGIYKITGKVMLNVGTYFVGMGMSANSANMSTTIKCVGNGCIVHNGYSTIRDMIIVGDDTNVGILIDSTGRGSNAIIDGVVVRNCRYGVKFEGDQCQDTKITNCRIQNCEYGISGGTWGTTVIGTTFADVNYGIVMERSAIISNCKLWNGTVGIKVDGINSSISNCELDGFDTCVEIAENGRYNNVNFSVLNNVRNIADIKGQFNYLDILATDWNTKDLSYGSEYIGRILCNHKKAYGNIVNVVWNENAEKGELQFNGNGYCEKTYEVSNTPNKIVINNENVHEAIPSNVNVYHNGSLVTKGADGYAEITGTEEGHDYTYAENKDLTKWSQKFELAMPNQTEEFTSVIFEISFDYSSNEYAPVLYCQSGVDSSNRTVLAKTEYFFNTANIILPHRKQMKHYIYAEFPTPVKRATCNGRIVQNTKNKSTQYDVKMKVNAYILG